MPLFLCFICSAVIRPDRGIDRGLIKRKTWTDSGWWHSLGQMLGQNWNERTHQSSLCVENTCCAYVCSSSSSRERDRDVCNSLNRNLPCSADIMGPAIKTVSTFLNYIIINSVESRDPQSSRRTIFRRAWGTNIGWNFIPVWNSKKVQPWTLYCVAAATLLKSALIWSDFSHLSDLPL